MKCFVFGVAFLMAMAARAACVEKYEVFDGTQIQVSQGSDACYFTVSPRDVPNLVYRDFLFDSNGDFMIFNSYGQGPESTSTAAREFYFFPRPESGISSVYDGPTKRLSVTMPSGKVAVFDTATAALLSISGTKLKLDPAVNPNNGGGVDVVSTTGIYLDIGFKVGQSPSQNPNSKATFHDEVGMICEVLNSDLFTYTKDQDVLLKPKTDAELRLFLKVYCPQLKF
jgi:hypothetical protein